MTKKVLFGLILFLVVIQFIPMDKTNPPVDEQATFKTLEKPTAEEMSLLESACSDCHSHNTVFPNYTKYQPLGWWIRGHVRGGRQKLNFSTWASYDQSKRIHKLEECIEVIEEKRMPMKSYTWLHPEAKLSAKQKEQLISLFKRLQKNGVG